MFGIVPMMARFAAMLAVAICAGTDASAQPKRIASFNLCADQLVVALADPERIAGLSPYAADPDLSVVAGKARAFPRLGWQAESTFVLAPDLVLVGPDDRRATRRMMTALGLRVVEVALVTDLVAARAQIIEIAALLGRPERGAALVAELDSAERRLEALPTGAGRSALIVERGGYVQGPSSLAAALIAKAGLRPPPGAPSGYGGYVSLEHLLTLRPDVLVVKDPPALATDQGALFFTHPALARRYPPASRIALPSRYALCGGPALIAALDYLGATMARRAP